AALAAHAVGDDGEQAAADLGVGDDLDLILLIGTVAAVQTRGGAESETWSDGGHRGEYKLHDHSSVVEQWTRTCIPYSAA
ncbi:MAG: hypothetical protein KGN16_25955, partial [Burkholderiales bacterium]|nr:hypothetical protein [Burkholderiales bacterium]